MAPLNTQVPKPGTMGPHSSRTGLSLQLPPWLGGIISPSRSLQLHLFHSTVCLLPPALKMLPHAESLPGSPWPPVALRVKSELPMSGPLTISPLAFSFQNTPFSHLEAILTPPGPLHMPGMLLPTLVLGSPLFTHQTVALKALFQECFPDGQGTAWPCSCRSTNSFTQQILPECPQERSVVLAAVNPPGNRTDKRLGPTWNPPGSGGWEIDHKQYRARKWSSAGGDKS